MQRRQSVVHGGDDLLVLMRAGDRENAGMRLANAAFLDAEAARDDDAAVGGDGFADGVKAFLFGAVEEAAGVDHDDIGAIVVAGDLVALRASRVMMRSLSTSALGQPKETKPTFGALLPLRSGAGAAARRAFALALFALAVGSRVRGGFGHGQGF